MVGIFRRSGIAMPLAALIAVAGASVVHAEMDGKAVLETYANIAEANYSDALSTAKALEVAIGALVARPSEEALKSARSAWKAARIPYQQTEAFRLATRSSIIGKAG